MASGRSRPKRARSSAMYSGVADAASPASTCAASPGARCSSRKFSTRMAKMTGTACNSRRSAKPPRPVPSVMREGRSARSPCARRPADSRHQGRLLVEVDAIERGVEPERAHDQILQLLVVDGHELELVHPHERGGLDDQLLELVVQRGPLLRV